MEDFLIGLQVHVTVPPCLQGAALSLGTLQKIKGCSMAKVEVFRAYHFVEQRRSGDPGSCFLQQGSLWTSQPPGQAVSQSLGEKLGQEPWDSSCSTDEN